MTTFAAIVTILCGILSFFETRSYLANRKLRRKLRRALKDCEAFYMIEQLYAETLSFWTGDTPVAVKRDVRRQVRDGGSESPSDHATPHQIHQELEKLNG